MHFLLSTRTHVAWGQERTSHGLWVSPHLWYTHPSSTEQYGSVRYGKLETAFPLPIPKKYKEVQKKSGKSYLSVATNTISTKCAIYKTQGQQEAYLFSFDTRLKRYPVKSVEPVL